jgi:hypothetical protein
MSRYYYYQQAGGEETWKACPVEHRAAVEKEKAPAFWTALAVSQPVEDLSYEDRIKLKYRGPLYFDWDAKDISRAIEDCCKFLIALAEKGVDLQAIDIYATGGRGFHVEVPMDMFITKPPKEGLQYLPLAYKEIALETAVDTLDLRVYSLGRGRQWRAVNVQRPNGKYKVPITWAELNQMIAEPELYDVLCSQPREPLQRAERRPAIELMVMFEQAMGKVKDRISKRKKKQTDVSVLAKMSLPSLQALLEGRGIKPGIGFHQIAMQLAVIADSMHWSEEQLAEKAKGLCESHESDGDRYNTAERRRNELIRMHRYMSDNPCYEFSVGAIKSLLSHEAPDLDGIPVATEDVEEAIKKADEAPTPGTDAEQVAPDEFSDVASVVAMTRFGVYANTEDGGKKRISAVSFDDVHILRSPQTGAVSCYEADVLVNGKRQGRQVLELDTFQGVASFNKFASKLSHALQGSDAHVRGLMMRIAEKGRKEGKTFFTLNREGLDMINVVNHEDEEMREPFMVWCDNAGVIVQPHIRAKEYGFSFQGFPDPRGSFRTDSADAPALADWIEEPGNKDLLRTMLKNLLTCQRPDFVAKLVGWYTACFYRMLFHKAYGKFPLLHINGAAGSGKTEMNKALLSLFFYNQEPKSLTPASTHFALQQHMAGSSSIPLMLDEYKPHDMGVDLHNKLKLMIRDAYNCRDVTRGGGTRDNDDYRSLYSTQLSAPLVFIAEAAEEESAVMERVVLATMVRPPASMQMTWSNRFHIFERNRQGLSVLGRYLALDIVEAYSVKQLIADFDPLIKQAQDKYMLSEADVKSGLPEEVLRAKQGAKERTVFNYTVARFGLRRFHQLIKDTFEDDSFDELFKELEDAVYDRMTDLLPSTQAEWVKVLSAIAAMSVSVDQSNTAIAIRPREEYALITYKGKAALELSARSAYHRYRAYCKQIGQRPLFPGDGAFLHGLKDSSALLGMGSVELKVPGGGAFIFDMDELKRMGVDDFRA